MEFGPRALGARSILASPIHPEMQSRLNEIKDREDFRPVAPVVAAEEAPKWFKGAIESPSTPEASPSFAHLVMRLNASGVLHSTL